MIQDRLKALRSEMAKRGISLYVVPTADFHESEYVGEHFKARKYITGFTGSAGTAVITMDEAGLWTDGRYFVQAAAQLKDTTVKLFKIGEEGVPTVDEYIKDTLSDGGVIGFDGRVVNAAWGKRLSEIAKEKHGSMYVNEDLIDLIWTDRPPMSKAAVMIFDNKYTGEDISSKLKRVREQMAKKGATLHLMSSLYDIAWLLNVRGGDISYVPVAHGKHSAGSVQLDGDVSELGHSDVGVEVDLPRQDDRPRLRVPTQLRDGPNQPSTCSTGSAHTDARAHEIVERRHHVGARTARRLCSCVYESKSVGDHS
jgi:Xaa-Pro aminopeptidase